MLVLKLRLIVEHRSGIAERSNTNVRSLTQLRHDLVTGHFGTGRFGSTEQIERMELRAGMLQKPFKIAQTLDVGEQKSLAVARDSPELSASRESCRTLGWTRCCDGGRLPRLGRTLPTICHEASQKRAETKLLDRVRCSPETRPNLKHSANIRLFRI